MMKQARCTIESSKYDQMKNFRAWTSILSILWHTTTHTLKFQCEKSMKKLKKKSKKYWKINEKIKELSSARARG